MLRVIVPFINPLQLIPTKEQEDNFKKLSSDRTIAGNNFGRILCLYNKMSEKYFWAEDLYDVISIMCVSLKNFVVDPDRV